MGKVILIHANCVNPEARGDYTFAGNIAKDLVKEITKSQENIDVILVSSLDGISQFVSLYGPVVNNRVNIENTSIGLSSLEKFDAIENTVVAFIDANRCKYAAADIVKRVLDPESKLLVVGNVNKQAYDTVFAQLGYRHYLRNKQPGLYELFSESDLFLASAGLSNERLGLPAINKAKDLPELSSEQQSMLPSGNYGFMYVNAALEWTAYELIAQYIKLSNQDEYILVGDFNNSKPEIELFYKLDDSLPAIKKSFPPIQFYQSLPNHLMRKMVAGATATLVASTGVTSTLEAMQDNKLPFYQDIDTNENFVTAYLIAVKSIFSNDTSLFGGMPQLLIELSNLLFAEKPLSNQEIERTQELLSMSSVSSRLVETNQKIIEQANGKIAPKLLSFIHQGRSTQQQVQLATVCTSLRKPGETGSPVHEQALRRAAAWGRLFELKVLIKAIPNDLDKKDVTLERTALHWAVACQNLDCARVLVKAGVSLDLQDKEGKTPLHKAVANGDKPMIEMLILAGARSNILDKASKKPKDCAPDKDTLLFMQQCRELRQPISAYS
ncbi:Ankyrin-repeat containing protein. Substrate of the Dot/Icm secretion system [Legionella beliardensis]|uniref:Ankyrin-repeat containing protein. Substrate of the Dot/Icm secretion system n=1 Tax=Legionella beliardensis TaxID=91822 RepID=A0A378I0T0_9GAMM|nr:Dot/Icm T4SS effector AnkY/LegA9 [Legionella beliardensis]STX28807.1 Ankyrin-repeat containing protein. Substrate of the Dot/Icm secretion system [Legionella beliardensis]